LNLESYPYLEAFPEEYLMNSSDSEYMYVEGGTALIEEEPIGFPEIEAAVLTFLEAVRGYDEYPTLNLTLTLTRTLTLTLTRTLIGG